MSKSNLNIIMRALVSAEVAINFKNAADNGKYKPHQRDILNDLSKDRVRRTHEKMLKIKQHENSI